MPETVKLKDVCKFKRGLTYSKKDEVDFSNNVVVRATNIDLENNKLNLTQLRYIKESIKIKEDKILKKGDILICTASGSKSHLGKVALIDKDIKMAFGGFMGVLRTSEKCLPKFLYNILISQKFKKVLLSNTSGANINNLRFSQIENFEFTLPPLPEQQLVITKLDASFTEIDNSVLINKNKLSSLRIIGKKIINKLILKNGSDFIKKPIHSLFNLSSGKFLPRKKMCLKGKIKVYGGNGITGYHDTFNLENENILIGRVGAYCGNVYYTNEKIWLTDNCLHINSYKYDFDKQFLSMLLSSLNIRAYAHQAAQPAISYTSLKNIELIFPKSIQEQTIIFKKYIDLKSNFKNLNNNYESQMISLKKLKLSILNKEIFNKVA